MNILASQQSIVTHLQADFIAANTAFLAKDIPDSSEDYDRGLKNPICYVFYAGSQADKSVSTRTVTQSRKARFNIELHARKLYSADGLYLVRDLMEQSVQGFAPVNCKRLYLLKDDISQTEEGVWVHVYQFECETMLVQKEDSDPVIVPSFQELINND